MDARRPILVAEDFEPDAALLELALKQAGVGNPIILVNDGDQAITYLQSDGPFANRDKFPLPGVLLLDLKMPRKSGFEVLQWCKTQPHLKELLLVVLSGCDEMREVSRAYALGANSFLLKPCEPEQIVNLTKYFTGYWTLTRPGVCENLLELHHNGNGASGSPSQTDCER